MSSLLLPKHGGVWLERTLGSTERGAGLHVGVRAAFKVVFARKVGAHGLGGGLEHEGAASWGQVGWVLALVALALLRHELLLGDQVVDAFVELHS